MSRRRRNEEMSTADAIRVLLSKEGKTWVAQCLEYDDETTPRSFPCYSPDRRIRPLIGENASPVRPPRQRALNV